ncbi:MAG: sigma 54-interacting transcriptional regulator [Ignavibacteriales bacterium]|nr:sigma 54-interacting transcriptional regulator [Ignavibacteriales bacterium]
MISLVTQEVLSADSPSVEELLKKIEPIILGGLGLIIVGEEGTEREYIASRIHQISGREQRLFRRFDCNYNYQSLLEKIIFGSEDLALTGVEINRGTLENVHKGSIYFENIEKLSPRMISRLVREVENQHFRRVGGVEDIPLNVRFFAGMDSKIVNKLNPETNELIHRLFPIIVNFPPFRERKNDILYYLRKSIEKYSSSRVMSDTITSEEFRQFVLTYSWPGNLKEFDNVMKNTISTAGWKSIRMEHLPPYLYQQYLSNKQVFAINFNEGLN